jgi:hypothetical protein
MNDYGYLFQFCCAAMFFGLSLLSTLWAYRDAERRGVGGCLIALLVFFTFPIGMMLWVVLRPRGARYW